MKCNQVIDMQRPSGSHKVRDFQPPWRTVFEYTCSKCGARINLRANAYRGKTPVPGIGGIVCGNTIAEEKLNEDTQPHQHG